MAERLIINIGRELGSGGRQIARLLAERFNLRFYDKELLELVAKESGLCSEYLEKSDETASGSSFFSGIPSMNLSVFGGGFFGAHNLMGQERLFGLQSDIIQRLAEESDCIFVGRCADFILRNNPGCVNVFISADMQDRVDRVSKNDGISKEEAQKLIEKVDRQRSAYYNYYTYQTWGAAKTYHLCVNSSRLGIKGTADFIASFVESIKGV